MLETHVCNTGAGARVSTTDVTEHISVCLFINAGLDGTAQRVEHALAEFPISRVSCCWYATLQGGCTDLLGLGGRGLALAAQAVPMAGQEAIVLVGEYEALLTPVGETVDIADFRFE